MSAVYGPRGLVVWAIADQEQDDGTAARSFVETLGIDMPVLWDEGGAVHDLYPVAEAFPSAAYPQIWLVGSDGNIAYVANLLDFDGLTSVIEAELGGG